MITKLSIENFRSIEKAELPLTKFNIFTGANNSGKSSVMYALGAYKSFMDNPNRSLDQILNLPFINMGPFKEIVFNKDEKKSISIKLDFTGTYIPDKSLLKVSQGITFNPTTGARITVQGHEPYEFSSQIAVALPYTLNKDVSFQFPFNQVSIKANWNGITNTIST